MKGRIGGVDQEKSGMTQGEGLQFTTIDSIEDWKAGMKKGGLRRKSVREKKKKTKSVEMYQAEICSKIKGRWSRMDARTGGVARILGGAPDKEGGELK